MMNLKPEEIIAGARKARSTWDIITDKSATWITFLLWGALCFVMGASFF